MFKDIPVDVGVVYEGERVRKGDMQVELGGPNVDHKFELVRIKAASEVEDGKIQIIGKDLSQLEEGGSYPLGILIEAAGDELEEDLEGILERRVHEFTNYIEGVMHLNQRYDIWIRVSKKSYQKGLNSFQYIGRVLEKLYKNDLPIIKKIQITFITDEAKVSELWHMAMKTYEQRDARARGLKDEEVDAFYGCSLCQSFAPTHVCVITPQRYANCGAISWFDGRAASRVDPKGPLFKIEIGDLIDPVKGEFSGVNDMVKKKSLGEIQQVWLYSAFGKPHTSCGCFEAAAYYVPEVDGLGLIHRDYRGVAVNGLPFSSIADSTAGGRQVDGFHGLSIEYMRSPKFLQADGGWERIVWMPSELKERLGSFIPKEMVDKIPTEKEVNSVEELKSYLKDKRHPVLSRWEKLTGLEEAKPPETEPLMEALAHSPSGEALTKFYTPSLPLASGGFTIILKDATIKAKKVIIKRAAGKAGS
ncbi:MAG: CO dehydrogenase/CO-methylating acetyl-CoA synthase complex subunit beta [Candidatus Bathyarchaeia archaeon]